MEMLHKHPEAGDILNFQDAKFFLGRKNPQTIIFDIGPFFFSEIFRYGKFQANECIKEVWQLCRSV